MKSRSRKRRWARRFLLAVPIICCLGLVIGKLSLDRIESDAAELAEIGTSLNQFLKKYGSAIKDQDLDGFMALHDDDYQSEAEGIWKLDLVEDRDDVQVYMWNEPELRAYRKNEVREQIQQYLSTLGKLDEAKFKISSIKNRRSDGSVDIEGLLWLRGHTRSGKSQETHSSLRIGLVRPAGEWLIHSKQLIYGETVVGSAVGFTDITAQSGIAFQCRHNPLLEEPEWYPRAFGIMKYATAGVATADYDNDGWYDIFFCDGTSSALYRNRGDGTFEDSTVKAGIPSDLSSVHVAIFGDFDNDNDRDLFLGRSTGNNYLFRNEGNGVFTDVTSTANVSGVWVSTASAADYDNDGRLDLYLGRYLDPRVNLPTTNFYTRNGQGNTLLHNEGDLKFKDVTQEAGVREGGLTLGIAWGDYDQDGDQDVFVANDFGRNALLRNEGNGKFSDVSKETGTLDIGYGMSASMEDIDNDGDLDIYKAAVHSGQRWFGNSATLQRYFINSFQEGTIREDYPLYREILSNIDGRWQGFGEKVIRGNSLLLNDGHGKFVDVSEKSRINPHGWYWSSAIFDFDNDGIQDIYTVNGWITGKEKDDL